MTRLTASLLTTALKAGSCVAAPGAAVGLPALGGGGVAGGGVTGFQACCATMYAVVPGVAAGPICGGTGGWPATEACEVVARAAGGDTGPEGPWGGTGMADGGTTCASVAWACSGDGSSASASRISFLKPFKAF